MTQYSRKDVVRILSLKERELRSWERAELVATQEQYTIQQMGELRRLRDLRARHIPARKIRSAMEAMSRVFGLRRSVAEISAGEAGVRMRCRHAGAWVEPLTQQMELDFGDGERGSGLLALPMQSAAKRPRVQEQFLRSVRLEEAGETVNAAAGYEALLEQEPRHAPTLINLGTMMYNQREFVRAEELYRRATVVDPRYALAWFDLGNALDELGRLREATEAYSQAVTLLPQYADAHYNLALAYERQGERRRALQHWVRYARLDPVGPWSAHARNQARRTLKAEKLSIVSRRGRLVQAG